VSPTALLAEPVACPVCFTPGCEREHRDCSPRPARAQAQARARNLLRGGVSPTAVAEVMRHDYPAGGWTLEAVLALEEPGALVTGAGLEVDAPNRTVAVNGQLVRLTRMEAAALAYLAARVDRLVSRDLLLTEVWGWPPGLRTRALDTHLVRVRQKLAAAGWPGRIESVRGSGYRLTP
jgi:DNA-binding response OmpR family regulator